MSYIAWDTETTGLPMTRQSATADNTHVFDKCRMVSIAFVKYDASGKELDAHYMLVKPDTFKVEATHIHGITHEQAVENGAPFQEVYDTFVKFIGGCKTLVAHNSAFDENVLFSECYRRGVSLDPFKDITFACTHKLVHQWYLKPKKLVIIYNELTGKTLDDAHNALADSRACGVIYPFLRDKKRVHNRIGIDRVVLKASDVASMIDKNRYKPPEEVIMNLWCKYVPETFKGQTKDQIAGAAISNCSVASQLLQDAAKFKSTDSTSLEQKYRAVTNQLSVQSDLAHEEMEAAKDHIRKTLYTNHGIRHEDATAEMDPTLKIDETFYTYPVCKIRGTEYVIVGRIDRISEDSSTIIEIKNRANRLFKAVRDYENIQCQTYMEMLNLDTCKLIEKHNDKTCTHLLSRDKVKWDNDILPKLKNFCSYFHEIVSK